MSTLIQDVSTAARSVLICDESINPSDIDVFDFMDAPVIAGQRKSYVGRVYVFDDQEPAPVDGSTDWMWEVEPNSEGLKREEQARELAATTGMSLSEARAFSPISPVSARGLKRAVEQAYENGRLPIWSGYPSFPDILSVNEVICDVWDAADCFGCEDAAQLTLNIQRLHESSSMREFFEWYASVLREDQAFDDVWVFLFACGHGIPACYQYVERMIRWRFGIQVDFSPFVAQMKALFRATCVRALEERGVPMQLSEKLYQRNDDVAALTRRLMERSRARSMELTGFEQDWIARLLR